MTRYRWVAARKAKGFPITMACKSPTCVVGVPRLAGPNCGGTDRTGARRGRVGRVDACDPRRVRRHLWRAAHDRRTRPAGTTGEPQAGPAPMRVHGIVGVFKPAKVRTTIPAEECPPLPDLVGRRFAPAAPDVVWCGDITYVKTGEGWLYVASVLDLGSRRLLGYSMADHMRTELVADALDMAAAARGGHTAGIIFHGDRGSQYMSGDYRQLIGDLDMVQSVGRTGVCWDNAVAESFWSSLKREVVHRYRCATRAEARREIFVWINRYNHRRLHSSLGYLPPVAWEQLYRHTQADLAA